MSANPAPRGRRVLAVTILLAVAAVLGALGAGPARAAAGATPGQQIAASLRKSPLYVDPSLSSAFPPAVRAGLLRQIRSARVPVYILAVPLANGGTWSSGDQLAAVVHEALGRPGVYLTTSQDFANDIGAYTWPSDPDGTDAAPYHAADAAQAANLAPDLQQAGLPDKFSRCLTLMANGKAVATYQAETKALDQQTSPAAGSGGSGGGPGAALYAAIAVAAVLIAGGGGFLMARRRRKRPATAPFVTPHSVFTTARNASEAELRGVAAEQVIRLGELVEQPSAPGGQGDEQVARALDAYEAAGKALDGAAGIPDLAGVLVLTHQGQNAIAAARALQAGQPEPPARPLCFFNPLHGEGRRQIHWRALGSRQSLDVSACAECADATARHRLPDVLADRDGDREIPYYEADPDRSVWAATGYGQFGDDLARRIITRGLRPGKNEGHGKH